MALGLSSIDSKQSGYLGAQTPTVVTNPFNTLAGSKVVLVIQAAEGYTAPWAVPQITDSLGSHLNWSVVASQADYNSNFAAVWIAVADSPSAQTGMTASVTLGVTDNSQTVTAAMVTPIVLTGVDSADPIVNVQKGVSSAQSVGPTLNPIYTGSYLFMVSSRKSSSPTVETVQSGNYLAKSYLFDTSYSISWFGGSSSPTPTSGVAKNMLLTTTDSPNGWQYIAFEVAPPHGAVAQGTGIVVGAIAF